MCRVTILSLPQCCVTFTTTTTDDNDDAADDDDDDDFIIFLCQLYFLKIDKKILTIKNEIKVT